MFTLPKRRTITSADPDPVFVPMGAPRPPRRPILCPDCETPFVPEYRHKRCTPCGRFRNEMQLLVCAFVKKAITRGVLVPQPCEVCGQEKAHAHHDDYSKPLKVRWLCRKHHQQHHAAEERATTRFAAEEA